MRKMRQVKPDIIYARRKARQAKLEGAHFMPYGISNNSSTSVVFNAQNSDSNIPLNPTSDLPYGTTDPHQRWDKNGRAIGFVGDPRLHAPAPRRPQGDGGYNGSYDGGGGIGTAYPQTNLEAGGRNLVRQESGDSAEWHPQERRDTFDIPRIASPVNEPINNPFELAPTHQTPYPPPLTPSQFANSNQQPAVNTNITVAPVPDHFTDATPTQFNHPQVPFHGHAGGAADASFHSDPRPPSYSSAQ